MSSHGKQYKAARAQFDRETLYSPVEAIKLLKGMQTAKFDETVEVHFVLGLNVRHADEQLRGTLMLPHGTGREMRVAVFAEGDKAREAEEAGGTRRLGRPRREDRGRLPRLRRRDRDTRSDGQRRQARARARPSRADAEPEDRHGHVRCREGRLRRQGRQARVPHRPRRQRPRPDREEELRRARARRELRGARSTRSSAPSPRRRRAATSRASPSPRRWAPACTSTPRGPAASSTSSRGRPSRPRFPFNMPVAEDSRQPSSEMWAEDRPRWPQDSPTLAVLSSPPPGGLESSRGGGTCTKLTRNGSSRS